MTFASGWCLHQKRGGSGMSTLDGKRAIVAAPAVVSAGESRQPQRRRRNGARDRPLAGELAELRAGTRVEVLAGDATARPGGRAMAAHDPDILAVVAGASPPLHTSSGDLGTFSRAGRVLSSTGSGGAAHAAAPGQPRVPTSSGGAAQVDARAYAGAQATAALADTPRRGAELVRGLRAAPCS